MRVLNVTQAKAQLSAVLAQVAKGGEEVIIAKAGTPVAKVIRYQPKAGNRRVGLFRGKVRVARDFNVWPDDIARSLGMID